MTIHFFPTLQQIAYVKVAQGILYTMDLEDIKHTLLPPGSFQRNEYIQNLEERVSIIVYPDFEAKKSCYPSIAPTTSDQQNCSFLPSEVQTQLVGIIMTLRSGIENWYKCHSSILHDDDLDLKNRLAWYSFGIINRFETARCFIQDENVIIKERFHLACQYYFEDSMHMLWRIMSLEDRHSFKKYLPKSRNMEVWLEVLEKNTKIDWRQIPLNKEKKFSRRNYLGLHYYFAKFRSPKMKCMCLLKALKTERLNHFDLYLCLFGINEDGLNKILRHWPHTKLSYLFKSFLEWPFQIIFLNVVNDFSKQINKNIFCELLIFILFDKIGNECKDYLYTKLLECYWNRVPESFRNHVKEDKELNVILRYGLEKSNFLDMERYRDLLKHYVRHHEF